MTPDKRPGPKASRGRATDSARIRQLRGQVAELRRELAAIEARLSVAAQGDSSRPPAKPMAYEGSSTVSRLMMHLSLSQDELGRMLGVSGETIRRWKTGGTPVPEPRLAKLTAAEGAMNRLLQIFRPERLPLAIRRPAELFRGKQALDWILDGRIAEVADRYELSLAYQA